MRLKQRFGMRLIAFLALVSGMAFSATDRQAWGTDIEARVQRAAEIMREMGLVPDAGGGIYRYSDSILVVYQDRAFEEPCPEIHCVYIKCTVYFWKTEARARSLYDSAASNRTQDLWVIEDISAGSLKAFCSYWKAGDSPAGVSAGLCGTMMFTVIMVNSNGKNAEGKFPSSKEQADFDKSIASRWNEKLRSVTSKLCAELAAEGLCSAALPPPSAGTRPPTTGGGGGSKDECGKERAALVNASLLVRFSLHHLETCRGMIAQVEKEWLDHRDLAFWDGTVNLALLLGSVAGKSLSALVSAGFKAALVESALKGVFKEGLKQYILYCQGADLAPGDVLTAVAARAGKESAKTTFVRFYETALTDYVLNTAMSGGMGGIELTMSEPLSVNDVLTGTSGGPITVREFIRKEYAAPVAATTGVLISLQSALDSALTTHEKLENLRFALQLLRDEEITQSRIWESRKQDLDVARAAFNYCRRLHPESPDLIIGNPGFPTGPGGQQAPLRRTAEVGEPRTGPPAAPAAADIVLPDAAAAIGLRDGRFVATVVQKGSTYEEQGLVVGSRLVSIDMTPIAERTPEEIKKLMKPADSEIVVFEFTRPDGQSIHVLIRVR